MKVGKPSAQQEFVVKKPNWKVVFGVLAFVGSLVALTEGTTQVYTHIVTTVDRPVTIETPPKSDGKLHRMGNHWLTPVVQ